MEHLLLGMVLQVADSGGETVGKLILTLFDGLEFIGPTIIAILTVPLFSLVKRYLSWVGGLAPWIQQILVVTVAGILTWVGTLLNVALPNDLSLFGEPEISTLLSAAMAYGIHAGKKAKFQ